MLIEFRVENHRSLRHEQALTLLAGSTRGGAAQDPRPREVAGLGSGRLLPVAALYGANASGKSNVLGALELMRSAVLHSHRFWEPDGGVLREPFAWGDGPRSPSLYEVTFLLAGARYEYGFVAEDARFAEEWLYVYPRGRRQVWFERDGNDFKFGEHFRGENRLVEQLTRPNALFISAAVQLKHEQLMPIFRWFRALRNAGPQWRGGRGHQTHRLVSWLGRLSGGGSTDPLGLFDDGASKPEPARRMNGLLNFIQAADVGIQGLKLVGSEDVAEGKVGAAKERQVRVLLRHQAQEGEDAWLPMEQESQGTLTLLHLAPVVLSALWQGGVVVADELEASLHPLLALHIVRQFNDPTTNPRGAQLIFTTHDTNLLGNLFGEAPLRRDQIWLTEKDNGGATRLYPLTDYKPRKAENLERGYLQGRYGAIPFPGELSPAIVAQG